MTDQTVTEARDTDSRLDLVRKLLAKAESTDSEAEREALTERASQLIAKYGMDRAMLADTGQEADPVVDKVIFAARPYARSFSELLWHIGSPLRAEMRSVRQWDPDDHGGRTKGAWHYGYRVFAHQSDLLRIELLYASLRNQALSGVSHITGTDQFAQDQRAYRINYLQGFSHAINLRLQRAEEDARRAREAEQDRLADEALLNGHVAGRSVELVLRDRRAVVKAAMDLAVYNITPQQRAEMDAKMAANQEKWAEQDRQAAERRELRREEQRNCPKCLVARSGYCKDHRDMRPRMGRAYHESVGADYYHVGRDDGRRADLGLTRTQVSGDSQKAIR